MKLVKKVSQNWKQMDGSSDLVKKINAYLTSTYITNGECPSDECVSYGERFALLQDNPENRATVKSVLIEYFWTASDSNGKEVILTQPAGMLDKHVNHIMELITNEKGQKN